MANPKHGFAVDVDALRSAMTAAYVAVMYWLPDGNCPSHEHFLMLCQSDNDMQRAKMSLFAYNTRSTFAVHIRLSLYGATSTHKPQVPTDEEGRRRTFICAQDLPEITKWLRPLPSGSVYFAWDDDNPEHLQIKFNPKRPSAKQVSPLNVRTYVSAEWADALGTIFATGRAARSNAKSGEAVYLTSLLPMPHKLLPALGAVFEGYGVDIVPFSNGSMVYVASASIQNRECVAMLAHTALANKSKVED